MQQLLVKPHLFPLTLIFISLLFQLLWPDSLTLLQYQRVSIADGQIWRILSAHLIHLNWYHFLLNSAGLVLIWILFHDSLSQRHWIYLFVSTATAISLCIYFFQPTIIWFAGLSGILHAMFTAGAVIAIQQHGWKSSIYLIIIIAKISWEQSGGALPGSTDLIGASVVTESHLYGAIAGLWYALLKMALPGVRN